jgi:Skp family chaperone for outer membrane proteins
MKIKNLAIGVLGCAVMVTACTAGEKGMASGESLKIAYVQGDTILHKFDEWRKESEILEQKQKAAEADLQTKGAALEKEIMDYQRKAQSGTMTGKEMEAREKYLGSRQEALMMERDKLAQEIMAQSAEVDKRLRKMLNDKLEIIKKREGYHYILNKGEGSGVLVADTAFDITAEVLKLLNDNNSSGKEEQDTVGKK